MRAPSAEAVVDEMTLAPKDLLNEWLGAVRHQARVRRRRSSDWFPEGYEAAPGPEPDQ